MRGWIRHTWQEEIDRFLQVLRGLKVGKIENVLMHGLRGVGKTVLLHRLVQMCIDESFLPIVRLQYSTKYSNPETFFRSIQCDLDRVIEAFSKTEMAKKSIRTFADYIKPTNIELLGVVSYKPAYVPDTKTSLEDQITEYLLQKWNTMQDGGYEGAVFLLDEFHTIKNMEQNGWHVLTDFIGAINKVQYRGCRYSFVLCGLPILPANIKIARSYSERMFTSFLIDNLDGDSTRKAISEPLKKTNWRFSDELVSSIVQDTYGYPYFIQFVCSEIISRINKEDIGLDDYSLVKNLIKKKIWHDFFDRRMESLSDGQIRVLHTMASRQEDKTTFSSIQKLSKIAKGPLSNHLRRLEEKGLIYRPKRGIYRFPIPMFQEYLLEKANT